MSKYEPLQTHLAGQLGSELPISFEEVERLLGFPLPPSARRHPQWWSNNVGSHVAVRAWRDVGWKTSKVDLGGEKVVFVREGISRAGADAAPMARGASPVTPDIIVPWSELNVAVQQLLGRTMRDQGVDLKSAILEALNAAVRESRRRLFEEFRVRSIGPTSDSVDLIHEDRDERP